MAFAFAWHHRCCKGTPGRFRFVHKTFAFAFARFWFAFAQARGLSQLFVHKTFAAFQLEALFAAFRQQDFAAFRPQDLNAIEHFLLEALSAFLRTISSEVAALDLLLLVVLLMALVLLDLLLVTLVMSGMCLTALEQHHVVDGIAILPGGA